MARMAEVDFDRRVEGFRRFNRFYTKRIGVLGAGFLGSPFALTEVRVLYELAHREKPTATELGRELGLDAGYLSRILRGFKSRGLIKRERSHTDGRQTLLSLTARGRAAFAPLEVRSRKEMGALLRELPAADQTRLLEAMHTIETLLGAPHDSKAPLLLRPHQPGDMGWVVHRHGVLYAQEQGYDERFEALVASIVAKFIENYDPKRERCWMAERDGEVVGSVFLVEKSKTVAKLRLLLIEPKARGLGLGHRLVGECVRFARQAGYKKLTLWTQSDLDAARHLYEKAGFHVVHKQPHHSFGRDLVAEVWDLEL
jgi:DNA-binding MarR family transcriptional regulator/N-acetylglutamate synthase-like GNAT family acetyltransferase